ncbi:MAG TPA: hypothetical protein VFQ23_14940 [Anaerolineales bacterium]|nr:hypothetical protein [Anaerolineales bacterium]
MSTIANKPPTSSNSLLRLSVVTGLVISTADMIIYNWLVVSILFGIPLITFFQYIASGALGESAFAGGIATAFIGVLFYFLISIVVAGVFILGVDRIPLLRRHIIPGSLLYGFGVFIVMNMIVTPLSATPPIPAPTTQELILIIVDHLLFYGLLLGILVRRNINKKES